MEPILVFVEEKYGKIEITKTELQRIVDEAYEQGKQDGTVSSPDDDDYCSFGERKEKE